MSDAEKIEKLKAALAWSLCELYGLKKYMERPDNGEWGVECAICRREWFEEGDTKMMDEIRSLLDQS